MKKSKGSSLLFTILLIPLLMSIIILSAENIIRHQEIRENYNKYTERKE